MQFEVLYYGDKLTVINPSGDVSVVTLWSKVDSVIQILTEAGIDLSRDKSRIAVVANLYGNGLPQMLRNLLWNPQVRQIVIIGKNLSGSREQLLNFFEHGLEKTEFLGSPAFRICNTTRIIDDGVRPEHFKKFPKFYTFGDLGNSETKIELEHFFEVLEPFSVCEIDRTRPAPMVEPVVTRFPSEARSHTIVRNTPLEAWSELIFRLYRFGHRNTITKSSGDETRVELQNVKVIVENPVEESDDVLNKYGFSLSHFKDYQKRILDGTKPNDLNYTYGNRLRQYFRFDGETVDSLQIVVDRLKKDPESRTAYISLWDNNLDLPRGKGCPCFVSCFFRKFENKLTLTATFRTHNAMDAWPENFYGLIAIQRFVAEKAVMEQGPITVISYSISIDPSSLEKAKQIASDKKTDEIIDPITGKLGPRLDHNGEFAVTFDTSTWELVVEHTYSGIKIGEYRGKNSEEVELQLARDFAVSEISHALYLGRELARKEFQMKEVKKNK